jgi:hypothetical protein
MSRQTHLEDELNRVITYMAPVFRDRRDGHTGKSVARLNRSLQALSALLLLVAVTREASPQAQFAIAPLPLAFPQRVPASP